jgi:hypothetical protein
MSGIEPRDVPPIWTASEGVNPPLPLKLLTTQIAAIARRNNFLAFIVKTSLLMIYWCCGANSIIFSRRKTATIV